MTLTKTEILDTLAEHGLSPSRALGQNFVVDPNTVRRIARLAAVGPGDQVVEIGAGLGSLTLALAETGASITAIEIDRRLLPLLERRVTELGVRVVQGDALSVDWSELLRGTAWTLVANLPYNVATPLIADLLDGVPQIGSMLVMVQREVGDRLVAHPGSDAFGAVSVKIRYWAHAELVGRVSAEVFVPKPRVESVLVRLTRKDAPAVDPEVAQPGEIFELVKAGFAQRRKMLRRCLASLIDEETFRQAGVASHLRAEDIDVDDWGRLASARRNSVTYQSAADLADGRDVSESL